MPEVPTLISIVGPTAVGKTRLSIQLAQHFGTEIISGDSRQMYRYLDIGTAKPDAEERAGIPHHLLDFLEPDQSYNAGQFERDVEALLPNLFAKHPVVIVVGGSTLYMDALWFGFHEMPEIPPAIRNQLNQRLQTEGLAALQQELAQVDPVTFERIDQQNPARIIRALEVFHASGTPISVFRKGREPKETPYRQLKIGLTDDRASLYERINHRVLQMLEAGLEQECTSLLEKGYSPDSQAFRSIGYQEMFPYLRGEMDQEEAIRLIQRNSRRYAKRQLTYYRRYPDIEWFQATEVDRVLPWVASKMKEGK
ncbi:MAG: tRNA (adenosine(37)-N6)-dimethylallyltransferase MiaA [Cyanobacteria bacterium P01_A01_bin.137]